MTDRAFGLGSPHRHRPARRGNRFGPGRERKLTAWTAQKDELCQRATTGYPEVAATDPERAAYLQQLAVENCADGYLYRAGDAANLAIGQGELAATPLQMAVVYAAIANGGRSSPPRRVGSGRPGHQGRRGDCPGPTRSSGLDPAVAEYVAEGTALWS